MKPQQRDKRDKPDKRAKRDYIFGKFGERDMFKPQSDRQDHRSTGHRPSWDRIRCHHCRHCHHCILGTVELLGSITNTCRVSSVSRLGAQHVYDVVQHCPILSVGAPADGSTEPQEMACLGKCWHFCRTWPSLAHAVLSLGHLMVHLASVLRLQRSRSCHQVQAHLRTTCRTEFWRTLAIWILTLAIWF